MRTILRWLGRPFRSDPNFYMPPDFDPVRGKSS